MNWNLEGLTVEGMYLGDYPVKGRVELSRVAYGGSIKHTVYLREGINLFGRYRDRVILDHEWVTKVMSNG